MGFIFNGTASQAVTISGTILASINQPSSTQTLVNADSGNVATGATVYTVTAGKTLYVTGLIVNGYAANENITLTIDGAVKFRARSQNTAVVASGGVIFSAAATKAIVLVHDGGGTNGSCVLWGVEV